MQGCDRPIKGSFFPSHNVLVIQTVEQRFDHEHGGFWIKKDFWIATMFFVVGSMQVFNDIDPIIRKIRP